MPYSTKMTRGSARDSSNLTLCKDCGEFLLGGTLNHEQQEFVREIIDYLRENGEVTPDDLTNDEPFADYDIGSLFDGRIKQLQEIIARLNAITGEAA